MKKIITAIGNPELNNNLKEINEFEIIANDIQYQEGILEILEEKEADILILSELLKGEMSLDLLIEEIKQRRENIKIILLVENEKKKENIKSENIEKILIHNKITIQEMIFILKEISTTKKLEDEIQDLKKLILENNFPNKKKENIIENKIITVAGNYGSGKSLISTCLAINFKKEKTLLVDFDILNKSINTILGNKISHKKMHWQNYNSQIQINSFLDYFCGDNLLKNEKDLNIFFEKIKNEYTLIIIDISTNTNLSHIKEILNRTDIILFLIEGNILEINKSNKILNTYINEWNIKKNKIKIIINKFHKNSIDEKIIKNIYSDFNILGKISLSKNYSLMINKNMKNYFFYRKEKREHNKILKNIFRKNEKIKGGNFLWTKWN